MALATDNLAQRSADEVYELFGIGAPPSVYDRCWLIMSLAEIGRFAEAAEPAAEAIRLAPLAQLAGPTIGMANWAAGEVHLLRGDWPKARSLVRACNGGAQRSQLRPRAFRSGRVFCHGPGAARRDERGPESAAGR